jgi:hypothetical protein
MVAVQLAFVAFDAAVVVRRLAELFATGVRQAEIALAARWASCHLLSAVASTMSSWRPC